MAELEGLPSDLSVQAVEMYATSDLANVRNPSGFMKGIIKQVYRAPPTGLPRGTSF